MNTRHTLIEKPEWVIEQESKGITVICNATRPLYGNATNDDWSMPFIQGRHFAALNPNDSEFSNWLKRNEQLDACLLIFVDKETALEAGLEYYRVEYPEYLDRINMDDPEHVKMLVNRGIDSLNGYD
jgi:hypothetical protein